MIDFQKITWASKLESVSFTNKGQQGYNNNNELFVGLYHERSSDQIQDGYLTLTAFHRVNNICRVVVLCRPTLSVCYSDMGLLFGKYTKILMPAPKKIFRRPRAPKNQNITNIHAQRIRKFWFVKNIWSKCLVINNFLLFLNISSFSSSKSVP